MSEEIPWTVPCRESLTQRSIGAFLVRIWRNVPLDHSSQFDPVVINFLNEIKEEDVASKRALEEKLSQIPDVTAIQVGDDNASVLYLG